VIVFTGEFEPYSKDELTELCQKLGAKTPASLVKGTTILLQGAYVVNQWKQKINQDITTTTKSV
jgi:NAD-dependent DNA ligase